MDNQKTMPHVDRPDRLTHLPHLSLLALLWLCSIPLACLPGPMELSFMDVAHLLGVFVHILPAETLPQHLNATDLLVVGELRFARAILALLCGGGLALAGVTLQGVLRNPLADPFTLGISAGAACGASIAITYGATLTSLLGALGFLIVPMGGIITASAFIGALLALALALILGHVSFSPSLVGTRQGLQRESVILAGIAVSTFLGAIVTLIKALHEESVTSIVFWIMGSFQGVTWTSVPVALIPIMIGSTLIALHWRDLDVLALGQRQALHLGMAVGRIRFILLLGASCMAAGCVAVAGIIAFVGLVVPHILRLWLGSAHGPLLIGAYFGGGLLLLWADVVARTLLSDGQELPVGVVMALLGGPFFALLVQQRRGLS